MLSAVVILFKQQMGLWLRKEGKKQKGTKIIWCVMAVAAVTRKRIGKGERVTIRWATNRKVKLGTIGPRWSMIFVIPMSKIT